MAIIGGTLFLIGLVAMWAAARVKTASTEALITIPGVLCILVGLKLLCLWIVKATQ